MRNTIHLILMLVFPVTVPAASIELPKTGQIYCYDQQGGLIPCEGTGQDGETQAGAAPPAPRFTDNSDGTVTDNLTSLIWLKNVNCLGLTTWAEGLRSVSTLQSGQCTLSDGSAPGDWRLPNVIELESLVDLSRSRPSLPDPHPFRLQLGYYWTSSTHAHFLHNSWVVTFTDGNLQSALNNSLHYVWPVRGGK